MTNTISDKFRHEEENEENQEQKLEAEELSEVSENEILGAIESGLTELPEGRELARIDKGKTREFEQKVENELVEPAAMERTYGALNRAKLIEKLDSGKMETLDGKDFETVANSLESRGWQNIFSELSQGDTAVYFTMPAGDLAVKMLNDEFFGQQLTDDIIDYRKGVMASLAERHGLTALHQDFRSGVLKLDIKKAEKLGTGKDVNGVLNDLGRELDAEMKRFISKKVAEKIKEIKAADYEINDKKSRVQKMEAFGKRLNDWGFKATFGASKVGASAKSGDFSAAALAVAEGQQTAQILRHGKQKEYGAEYSKDLVMGEIEKIIASKDQIDTVLYDQSGMGFEVFQEVGGQKTINRDLVRAVRKNKFEPAPGQEIIFEKVRQYIRRINLLDLFKPYTAEEISGQAPLEGTEDESLAGRVAETKRLIGSARNKDLNQTDRRAVAERLSADQKDSACTSPEIFHSEALKMDSGVYISIDVMDLGVDLLTEYESLLHDIHDGKTTLAEATLRAGDNTTKKMRDVRQKVNEICGEYFPGEKVLTLVGGDEVTIALEGGEDVSQLMLDLQKATNTRVVKTVVGSAERMSDEKYDAGNEATVDRRLREHLGAIKKAEQGSDIAKKIESMKRDAELRVSQYLVRGGMKDNKIAQAAAKERIKQIGLESFVIQEEPGGEFTIFNKTGRRSLDDIAELLKEAEQKAEAIAA